MKVQSWIAAALLVVPLCLAPPARAVEKPVAVRATLAAIYHKFDLAIDHMDSDGATADLDPDATVINTAGETGNVSGVRDTFDKLFSLTKSASCDTKIVKCTLGKNDDGDQSATTTVNQVAKFVVFTPKGARVTIITRVVVRDYWVQAEEEWSIKQTHTLTDITTVNGKRYKSTEEADQDLSD